MHNRMMIVRASTWSRAALAGAILVSSAVEAEQWVSSLATTASLRTGGATLVSSDALHMDDGQIALITYWERRAGNDLDIYRCVDVVDESFHEINQQCSSVLRPTGRGPIVIDHAESSRDICDEPDDFGDISKIAYCPLESATQIRTPYFEITIEPLGDKGLVSVSGGGRVLSLTGVPWPGSSFLEVRAIDRRDRAFFADARTTRDIVRLANGDTHCRLTTSGSRDWATCQSADEPSTTVRYLIEAKILYEISFRADVTADVRRTIDAILTTFDTRPRSDN